MEELKEFDVELSEVLFIESYDNILKIFKEWTNIDREIKLNSLLEGKRIQFDIKDINTMSNSLFGVFWSSLDDTKIVPLSKAAFVIKEMSFILNGRKVEKLSIKIKVLTTGWGKTLSNLIDDGIPIKINQYLISNKVHIFYIGDSKLAA